MLLQLWLLERYFTSLLACLSVLSLPSTKCSSFFQPSWVTDEEFGNGYLDNKPAPSFSSKSSAGNSAPVQGSSSLKISQSEAAGGKAVALATLHSENGSSAKDPMLKTKPADGRLERTESVTIAKSDPAIKLKGGSLVNGSDSHSSLPSAAVHSGMSRSTENPKQVDESTRNLDENMAKVATKNSTESEVLCEILWLT